MKTKFIEGTNEQYSIREDGIVIRHYSHTNRNTVFFKNKILKVHRGMVGIYFNKKRKTLHVKKLLAIYFNIRLCNKCGTCLKKLTNHVCDKCKLKTQSKFDKIKKIKITKSYCASMLGINVKDLSEELYLLYKANLQTKRKLSEKTKLHFNKFN